MKLIIVESPTKAKTISKFVGKDYKVKSSFGHIRDLPKKDMGIDIENNFKPKYVIPTKAKPKVKELKELAEKADSVILASDEDREGEAIAWHLMHALKLDKKDKKASTKRIVFHEITKNAINHALENPRDIDLHLVDAQQARRILDRLVGYELSPFLWKKIKYGLSAGRVQSVAVRIVAEREREIEKFKAENYFTITTTLVDKKEKEEFEAQLSHINGGKIELAETLELFAGKYRIKKTNITNEKSAGEIEKDLKDAAFTIESIEKKETLRHPTPPFTTSTLQQASINRLGWSAKKTMTVAQKLYEKGFITYMRTDSVNLAQQALEAAQKAIKSNFGSQYAQEGGRRFKTKSKGAQEAHEAIRPTDPNKSPADISDILEADEIKLYKLIWSRMIASQMKPAIFDSVKVTINAKNKDAYTLRANGSTIKFEGYLKAYGDKSDDTLLPALTEKEAVDLVDIAKNEKTTSPPPRYTEASLVKVLEQHNVGRPSTYAPTISTVMDRKYIEKNEEKRLIPLDIGLTVNDLLVQHFPDIVNIDFTAQMEEDLDEIAEGKKEWAPVIKEFYEPFHDNLEKKSKEIKKEDLLEKLDRKCPDCGGDLLIKYGRFGKFIACSNYPDCKYTEKTEEDKALDEKIEKEGIMCDKCGKPMVVKRGRYGTFLGCSGYPECKNIQKMENKTGVKCPKCGEGDIVERKSKKGRMFYGCSRYPDCDFSLWQKPTGETCPKCSSLLVHATKGKVKCSNKECKFEKEGK